jgi:hypothetical protein
MANQLHWTPPQQTAQVEAYRQWVAANRFEPIN